MTGTVYLHPSQAGFKSLERLLNSFRQVRAACMASLKPVNRSHFSVCVKRMTLSSQRFVRVVGGRFNATHRIAPDVQRVTSS